MKIILFKRFCPWTIRLRHILISMVLMITTTLTLSATAGQQHFDSPETAVAALFAAVNSNDEAGLLAILGHSGSRLISSGDEVADRHSREVFVLAYTEEHKLVIENENLAQLVIGKDEWVMPIPLVQSSPAGWRFDTRSGAHEILARRIGRNELAAIQVCLAIVDAEREYAAQNPQGEPILTYASRLVSLPGKQDGLYWPTTFDEQPSPLGPLLAKAAKEGYTSIGSGSLTPYHGYFYKILTRQGKHAAGGAYSYLGSDRLSGGFGIVAYPARYGVSGIMTFLINHEGVLYEANLGRDTTKIASGMKSFDPDARWKKQ
jgi:hypothetical protein